MVYDLIIIGSGAAGLAAALYAGRYQMKVLIIGKKLGGQTRNAGIIENYPGVRPIDGFDLMILMKQQTDFLRGKVIEEEVTKIDKKNNLFEVATKEASYTAYATILAIGAEHKRLNLPNEDKFAGNGVHYCATCDGPLYKNKTVAMIGGSDAAIKGANLLSEYAQKIYIINLEDKITAEPINFQQTKRLGDKVEIILGNTVKEIVGKQKLEKIVLKKPYQGKTELAVDGMFVQIGTEPNLNLIESLEVEKDQQGYVKVDNQMKTNVEGFFAAGDITNHFGAFKQIITAAAMGSVAATSAYEYRKSQDL